MAAGGRGREGAGAVLAEDEAWALVRALRPRGEGARAPLRVDLPAGEEAGEPRTSAWLEVDAEGRWTTSVPPSDVARDLLDLYVPLQLRPALVIGQLGQSLDGRIATESGHSHYVTGPADIRRLHRLRALVDAVIVGASTVAADDPRLTVRAVEGEDPVRVVLDPDGRLDPDRRVFAEGARRTIVFRRAGGEAAAGGGTCAAEVVPLPAVAAGGFAPAAVVAALRDRGLRRLLVEGGGITVSRFLQAGVLDRLHVTVAPLLIGPGRPALTLDPVATLDQALRPRCRTFRLGDDVLFDLELR